MDGQNYKYTGGLLFSKCMHNIVRCNTNNEVRCLSICHFKSEVKILLPFVQRHLSICSKQKHHYIHLIVPSTGIIFPAECFVFTFGIAGEVSLTHKGISRLLVQISRCQKVQVMFHMSDGMRNDDDDIGNGTSVRLSQTQFLQNVNPEKVKV